MLLSLFSNVCPLENLILFKSSCCKTKYSQYRGEGVQRRDMYTKDENSSIFSLLFSSVSL